mmetsp:Transcript_12850/g.36335  ORF Transcript_12850/g.36335 Transcript_12850/m.36335 type:complete len:232 (-) Transcript_12850:3333-4028(-)
MFRSPENSQSAPLAFFRHSWCSKINSSSVLERSSKLISLSATNRPEERALRHPTYCPKEFVILIMKSPIPGWLGSGSGSYRGKSLVFLDDLGFLVLLPFLSLSWAVPVSADAVSGEGADFKACGAFGCSPPEFSTCWKFVGPESSSLSFFSPPVMYMDIRFLFCRFFCGRPTGASDTELDDAFPTGVRELLGVTASADLSVILRSPPASGFAVPFIRTLGDQSTVSKEILR